MAFSFSGNAFVLGIGFLLTPIIARIYGPNAYGQFAVFTAIISLIRPISTLQLQTGYVAAHTEHQFADLIKLTIITIVIVSLITLAGTLIYINWIDNNNSDFPPQLVLSLPVYLFFAGVYYMFRGWNIKLEEFKRSAQSKVVATLVGKSTTLGYGIAFSQNAIGMVIGSVTTFALEAGGYISGKMFQSIKSVLNSKTSLKSLKKTIYEFASYPKFVTTNTIVNNISTQIPIYFIAAWYTTEKVGLFSLALSLIVIPVNLLGTSIGAVFLPRISAIIEKKQQRREMLLKLYKSIFYPGMVGMALLAIILKLLLPVILGDNWYGASQLSAIMAMSFVFTLVSLPLGVTFRLIYYEQANLLLTVIFIIIKLAGLAVGLYTGSFIHSILGYFAANILHNSSQVYLLFRKLEIPTFFIIRDMFVSMLAFVLVFVLTYLG